MSEFCQFWFYKIAEPSSPSVTAPIQTAKARISLVRSFFSFISFEGVSRIRQTSLRRSTSEGLIAPRSPALPPSLPPPSPRPRSQYLTPPPRSPRPNPDLQEIEVHSSPQINPEFKLDNTTPARRRLQPNQRMGVDTGMSSRTSGRSLLVED